MSDLLLHLFGVGLQLCACLVNRVYGLGDLWGHLSDLGHQCGQGRLLLVDRLRQDDSGVADMFRLEQKKKINQ